MEAFEVTSWEEVLAFFQEGGGLLENRWGWLEILRRGEDGDLILSNPWDAVSDSYKEAYRLHRDGEGRILVGDIDHAYFANHQTRYTLISLQKSMPFSTPYSRMHWHISTERHSITGEDREAIRLDLLSIVVEGAGYLGTPIVGPEAGVGGVGLQAIIDTFGYYGAIDSFIRMVHPKKHGGLTSDELLGLTGAAPIGGMVVDLVDIVSHASGWRIRVSP